MKDIRSQMVVAILWTVVALGILTTGGPAAQPAAAQEGPAAAPKKGAEGRDPHAILSQFKPTGASKQTAQQDGLGPGVEASHKMARTDGTRVLKHREKFDQAGKKLGLPPALLAAIASRESRGGAALKNGWGDSGNAFGILQVDKRYHEIQGGNDPASLAHIQQAAGILQSYRDQVQKKHPKWAPARQLQGAVVAYNSGVGNVQTLDGMDVGTTGNDYSNDVWARAEYYAQQWGK